MHETLLLTKKKETLLDGIGETNATPAKTVKEQKKKKEERKF